MRGRPPKPTALKKLTGNPGHRPLNDAEPIPPDDMPEMPKGMGHIANREWRWMAPALKEMGLLSAVDGRAFAGYCKAAAMVEIYFKIALDEPMHEEPILNSLGLEIGTKIKVNPAHAAYLASEKVMLAFLSRFGLTPADRARIKIERKPAVDPGEEFMKRAALKDAPEQAPIGDADLDMPMPELPM